MNKQLELKEYENIEAKTKEKLEKMKFCIISCHKSQASRAKLLMFALENRY